MLMHPLLQSDLEKDCSTYDAERKSVTWATSEPAGSQTSISHKAWSFLCKVLHWTQILKPFSKSPITNANPATRSTTSSRTASYDGLRGLACLIVFNFHFLYPYTKTTWRGYGVTWDEGKHEERWIHQLPIVCLVARGRAMVVLFFAISGYVLSYNYLATVRSGDWVKGYSRLASLALRRWMRLYLPASISMMMVCFGAYMGAFEAGRKFNNGNKLRTGEWEHHPPRLPNATAQIHDFVKMYYDWLSPWQWRHYWSPYDPHTWTIPIEFKGSMVLFITLLAGTALKPKLRTGLLFVATWFWFYCDRWEVATFTGGALVADLHQYSTSTPNRPAKDVPTLPVTAPVSDSEIAPFLPAESSTDPENVPSITLSPRGKQYLKTAFIYLILFIGLYGLSYPDENSKTTPGFRWIRTHTPRGYKTALASFPLLWAVEKIPSIRAFLSSPIPQYYGQISFGFYLMHGPVLHSVGFVVQPWIWRNVTGHDSLSKWLFGLALGYCIMLPTCMGVGHLFWKFVDAPLVRFARWLESVVMEKDAFQERKSVVK